MRINIEKEDSGIDIREDLRKLAQNLTDIDAILDDIAEVVKEVIQRAFDQSASPIGEAWLGLSQATIEIKLRDGFGTKPLVRTGALRGGVLIEIGSGEVQIGWSGRLAEIAAFHNLGTKHMPARPLVSRLLPSDARREIQAAITEHLVRGLTKRPQGQDGVGV